jgi:hypothetical protein
MASVNGNGKGDGSSFEADELESHLELHTEDNIRAGMSPREARRQALIQLGGLAAAQ